MTKKFPSEKDQESQTRVARTILIEAKNVSASMVITLQSKLIPFGHSLTRGWGLERTLFVFSILRSALDLSAMASPPLIWVVVKRANKCFRSFFVLQTSSSASQRKLLNNFFSASKQIDKHVLHKLLRLKSLTCQSKINFAQNLSETFASARGSSFTSSQTLSLVFHFS